MGPVNANRKYSQPQLGGTGRPPFDVPFYGGDGGGGNEERLPSHTERLRRYRFGITIVLVSIVTLFAMLAGAYVFRQTFETYDPTTGSYARHWQPFVLPVQLLWLNTIVLAVSSITMEVARRRAARRAILAPVLSIPGIVDDVRPIPWLAATVILGCTFLAGQVAAWGQIRAHLARPGSTSDGFFYVLTGVHALHLAVGLVALFYGLFLGLRHRRSEQLHLLVDTTAWYWHVIGALWMCLFALFLLAP